LPYFLLKFVAMYTYIWYSLPSEKLRKWTGHFFKKRSYALYL